MVLAQNELEWLAHIGDGGVAVAILIMLIVVAVMIVAAFRIWRDVRMAQIELEREDRRERREDEAKQAAARLEIERDRVKAEDRQASVMSRLEMTLDGTSTALKRVLEMIATVPTRGDLQAAGQAMADWADGHDRRMALALEQIKVVPNEVWRLGDPKLDSLSHGIRAGLEPLIVDLQNALETGFARIEAGLAVRLEAMGDEISPAMRSILNQELAQYQHNTQRQMDNLRRLVEALRDDLAREGCNDRASQPPGVPFGTPDDQAAGEDAAPSPFSSEHDQVNS